MIGTLWILKVVECWFGNVELGMCMRSTVNLMQICELKFPLCTRRSRRLGKLRHAISVAAGENNTFMVRRWWSVEGNPSQSISHIMRWG